MNRLVILLLAMLGCSFVPAQNVLQTEIIPIPAQPNPIPPDLYIPDAGAPAPESPLPHPFAAEKTMACAAAYQLSTGYPAWTHFWAGFMVNINNIHPSDDVMIRCFEARFEGNAGYRIYTKPGTFVGSETNSAAWTTVGTIGGGLNGTGAPAGPTAIPITVNVAIPPGGTQAFYLTRTSNTVGKRHLYIIGTGTAGTTVYASDANMELTEASYIDNYFVYSGTPRRPSMDIYYDLIPILPVNLKAFHAEADGQIVNLSWETLAEREVAHFKVEKSKDAQNWETVLIQPGQGTAADGHFYSGQDLHPYPGWSFYRLSQTDLNGNVEHFDWKSVGIGVQKLYVDVWPSPASADNLNMELAANPNSLIELRIMDVMGNCFWHRTLESGDGNLRLSPGELGRFSPGIYIASVQNGEETQTKRFVIK